MRFFTSITSSFGGNVLIGLHVVDLSNTEFPTPFVIRTTARMLFRVEREGMTADFLSEFLGTAAHDFTLHILSTLSTHHSTLAIPDSLSSCSIHETFTRSPLQEISMRALSLGSETKQHDRYENIARETLLTSKLTGKCNNYLKILFSFGLIVW